MTKIVYLRGHWLICTLSYLVRTESLSPGGPVEADHRCFHPDTMFVPTATII
jgi:hypothetical protein